MPRPKRRDDFYRDRRRRKVCAFCADKTRRSTTRRSTASAATSRSAPRSSRAARPGTCAQHQRELSVALKRARHVALLPYAPQHLRP